MRKRYGVTAEQFLDLWAKSKSVDEFCLRSGMPKGPALSRASYYRVQKGLPVKSMGSRGGSPLDLDRLRSICVG